MSQTPSSAGAQTGAPAQQVTPPADNLRIYNAVRSVPTEAQKKINDGRLSGKTDINPMWRIKALTDAIDVFWNENILKKVEPEAIDENDVSLLWPTSEDGKLVQADESDIDNCKEYLRLTKEKEEIEEKLGMVTTALKSRLESAEALIATDPDTGRTETVVRFKSINETVFDEEKFRNEKPEEYVKYLQQYFDKNTLKEEDKALWNAYCTKRKGTRRFAVLLKEQS